MKKGTRANLTGNQLERVIDAILVGKGYEFVKCKSFERASDGEQSVYTRQLKICLSIYDNPLKCDFVIYHPQKHPNWLAIEAKWQQASGSVDEKYPYLALNVKERFPCPAIIVLAGSGYKKKAEEWLRDQVDGNKLLHVFNMEEFQKWANSDEL